MRYTRQARRDILDIWLQIAVSRPISADRVIDRIKARCSQLKDFPHMGPVRPDIFAEARIILIDRWLAIYLIDARGPQIVRIVDAARDLRDLTFLRD